MIQFLIKIDSLKIINILVFLLCCFNCNLTAQFQEPTYEGIVGEYFRNDSPGAAVLVSKKGTTIFKSSIGFKNITSNHNIHADDIFRNASLTKQFTEAAI